MHPLQSFFSKQCTYKLKDVSMMKDFYHLFLKADGARRLHETERDEFRLLDETNRGCAGTEDRRADAIAPQPSVGPAALGLQAEAGAADGVPGTAAAGGVPRHQIAVAGATLSLLPRELGVQLAGVVAAVERRDTPKDIRAKWRDAAFRVVTDLQARRDVFLDKVRFGCAIWDYAKGSQIAAAAPF